MSNLILHGKNTTHGGDALAAPFVGFIIGTMLFGITLLQTYQYFLRYPNDSLYCKVKVAAICVLDLLHFVFSATLMYTFLISNFGIAGAHMRNVWSLKALAITQTALIILVQMVYLERIHTLSNIPALNKTIFSRVINGVIGLLIPCALAIGTVCCYQLHNVKVILSLPGELAWAVYLAFGSSAVFDLIIASMMCFVLRKHRLNIGANNISRRFNQLVVNLIGYALATGLLTTFTSILVIVLFIARPNALAYIAVTFSITRLYSNSVLAMLNVRKKHSTKPRLVDSQDLIPLSAIVFAGVEPSPPVHSSGAQGAPNGLVEVLYPDS